MTEPENIDLSQIQLGPIRHKSLPPELLEQVEAVYEAVGPYLDMTLEQFEIGFMRDLHPEIEVAVWAGIVAAWLTYHERYLDEQLQPKAVEKQLVAALIAISTGVGDAAGLGVPADVGRNLLACYDEIISE